MASKPPDRHELAEALRQQSSDRKKRLLQCAIIRNAPFEADGHTIWELLPTYPWFAVRFPNAHEAIEIVERFVDGQATDQDLGLADGYFHAAEYFAEADRFGYDAESAVGSEVRYGVAHWLYNLAQPSAEHGDNFDYYLINYDGQFYSWGSHLPLHKDHRKVALQLIEDIFGNPFRPTFIDPNWLAWNDGTVVKLAKTIYDNRRWEVMPILADALEDAMCTDRDILDHCRGPGPHVRGCWVVDLILGK
jgi:hypothetical protein